MVLGEKLWFKVGNLDIQRFLEGTVFTAKIEENNIIHLGLEKGKFGACGFRQKQIKAFFFG